MNRKTFSAAFRASLPVMAGYLVLGMGFGVLLQTQGYSFFWAFLMSLTIYAGSMQYAALDLISGGASLITCALMTLMINARHFFYGLFSGVLPRSCRHRGNGLLLLGVPAGSALLGGRLHPGRASGAAAAL